MTLSVRLSCRRTNSTMANKAKKLLWYSLSLLIWLLIWDITARALDVSFILPSVKDTAISFGSLALKAVFWKSISLSLLRVLIGFTVGCILGFVFGVLTHFIPHFGYFISPVMSVIRATPVASVILLLWFFIGSARLPSTISVLIVAPLVWQSTLNAFGSVSKELLELAKIYSFSPTKRIRALYFPAILDHLLPAVLTSTGLAWKSGIAAEIISYTKNSIGKEISDSKNLLEGADMLAWTLTVIILSFIIEYGIKYIHRRINEHRIKKSKQIL